MRLIDLTGMAIGRLTVIGQAEDRDRHGQIKWLCQCECGNRKSIRGSELRAKKTNSCGCLISEGVAARNKKHGLCYTGEYRTWATMQTRCGNRNDPSYVRYGARGISICARWLDGDGGKDGFECFFEDMGKRPSPDHTLDRIDNNGNYEPGNCRWATRTEQANNKRNTIFLEYNGERKSLSEWCAILGLKPATVISRIRKGGYSVKEALTMPLCLDMSERFHMRKRRCGG
jgi:hypothetical protein